MSRTQNPESDNRHPVSGIRHPASVAFVTLGCKVNQYETQVMREALKRRGFRVVASDDAADVYVINTCTVTGISDRKSRQMIRRSVALNPDAVVVVTGCYAERSPDEIGDIAGVDLVLSNREKLFIGEYLSEFDGKIRLNPSIIPIPSLRSAQALAFPHRGGGDLPVDGKIPLNPPLQKGDFEDQALTKGDSGDQALTEGDSEDQALTKGDFENQIQTGGKLEDHANFPLLETPSSSPLCEAPSDSPPLERGVRGDLTGTPTPQQSLPIGGTGIPACHAGQDGGSTETHSLPGDQEIPLNPPLQKGDFEDRALTKGEISSSPLCKRGVRGDFTWHPGITRFDGQTRALVKIEDGCDSFCTYCIVPHVRGGAIRSRPIDSIVREVRSLAGNGYKEVVLTGVHLGAYGRELTDDTGLSHVLRAIHDVDGIERVRLSSIEPMDISDDLINEMARLPKCAHHFHVSLQSGSDKILKLMRRGYTSAEFEDMVNRIRSAIPDVGISTDVMVGFPGETERNFRDTCDLIARVKFNRLHVFRYSPREGTPAAKFPDQVQDSVASRRSREVRALGDSLAQEFRSRMLGQEADVLVEDSREGMDRLLAGFTSNYVRVLIADAPDELAGQMIRVKLVDMENEYLVGISV